MSTKVQRPVIDKSGISITNLATVVGNYYRKIKIKSVVEKAEFGWAEYWYLPEDMGSIPVAFLVCCYEIISRRELDREPNSLAKYKVVRIPYPVLNGQKHKTAQKRSIKL